MYYSYVFVCRNFLVILHVFKIVAFCISMYVFCSIPISSKFWISDLGTMPMAEMIMGTILTVFICHCFFISMLKSMYFLIFPVYVSFRLCVFGTAISIRVV